MDCTCIYLLNIWGGTQELQEETIIKNVIYIYIFSWFQQLMNKQSTVLINTTYRNVHFLNQVKGEIPRRGRIYTKT